MISTPDLCDQFPEAAKWLGLDWRRYGGRPSFSGEISTVRCFEDNSRVADAVQETGNNRVLLVDGGGSLQRALLGDRLAEAALSNGWSGIVVCGAIRDVEVIREMPLGVFALRTCPLKTEKKGLGERDVVLDMGGVTIAPGMWLYADANGVIVSEQKL